jgi:hypothetical protein
MNKRATEPGAQTHENHQTNAADYTTVAQRKLGKQTKRTLAPLRAWTARLPSNGRGAVRRTGLVDAAIFCCMTATLK